MASAVMHSGSTGCLRPDGSTSIEKSAGDSPRYGEQCSCCPYGYHIDLDFLRYLDSLYSGDSLRNLRRVRHSRSTGLTQSCEGFLSDDELSRWRMLSLSPIHSPPPRSASSASHVTADDIVSEIDTSMSRTLGAIDEVDTRVVRKRKPPVKTPPERRLAENGIDIPEQQQQAPVVESVERQDQRQLESGSSSIQRSTTVMTEMRTSATTSREFADKFSGLMSGAAPVQVPHSSITHRTPSSSEEPATISPAALQAIREQMAASLQRMRELEEQVRIMATMDEEINSLRQENRRLYNLLAKLTDSSDRSKITNEFSEMRVTSEQCVRTFRDEYGTVIVELPVRVGKVDLRSVGVGDDDVFGKSMDFGLTSYAVRSKKETQIIKSQESSALAQKTFLWGDASAPAGRIVSPVCNLTPTTVNDRNMSEGVDGTTIDLSVTVSGVRRRMLEPHWEVERFGSGRLQDVAVQCMIIGGFLTHDEQRNVEDEHHCYFTTDQCTLSTEHFSDHVSSMATTTKRLESPLATNNDGTVNESIIAPIKVQKDSATRWDDTLDRLLHETKPSLSAEMEVGIVEETTVVPLRAGRRAVDWNVLNQLKDENVEEIIHEECIVPVSAERKKPDIDFEHLEGNLIPDHAKLQEPISQVAESKEDALMSEDVIVPVSAKSRDVNLDHSFLVEAKQDSSRIIVAEDEEDVSYLVEPQPDIAENKRVADEENLVSEDIIIPITAKSKELNLEPSHNLKAEDAQHEVESNDDVIVPVIAKSRDVHFDSSFLVEIDKDTSKLIMSEDEEDTSYLSESQSDVVENKDLVDEGNLANEEIIVPVAARSKELNLEPSYTVKTNEALREVGSNEDVIVPVRAAKPREFQVDNSFLVEVQQDTSYAEEDLEDTSYVVESQSDVIESNKEAVESNDDMLVNEDAIIPVAAKPREFIVDSSLLVENKEDHSAGTVETRQQLMTTTTVMTAENVEPTTRDDKQVSSPEVVDVAEVQPFPPHLTRIKASSISDLDEDTGETPALRPDAIDYSNLSEAYLEVPPSMRPAVVSAEEEVRETELAEDHLEASAVTMTTQQNDSIVMTTNITTEGIDTSLLNDPSVTLPVMAQQQQEAVTNEGLEMDTNSKGCRVIITETCIERQLIGPVVDESQQSTSSIADQSQTNATSAVDQSETVYISTGGNADDRVASSSAEDASNISSAQTAFTFEQSCGDASGLSDEMLRACAVYAQWLFDSSKVSTEHKAASIEIIQTNWFHTAGRKSSSATDVRNHLAAFERIHLPLMFSVANMADADGNTALHYAVSHCNMPVIEALLDSGVCDVRRQNRAGYTSIMLASLLIVDTESHVDIIKRLFTIGDVNVKSSTSGQTALMLAASHGRCDMVRLLLESGADVNARDEDGSTALMCACEHGYGDIVELLLGHPACDSTLTDVDGSTALSIAMDEGHRDIGVLLYAHMNAARHTSPNELPEDETL